MIGRFVPCELHHVAELLEDMTPADADEIRAFGMLPAAGALHSLRASLEAWAWETEDGLAAIFGLEVPSMLGRLACPWMLTTPRAARSGVTLARESARFIERAARAYPELVNVVHAEHKASLRWLRWLGFHITEPEPSPATGAPLCVAILMRGA